MVQQMLTLVQVSPRPKLNQKAQEADMPAFVL
jgi:hypothetical protein